MYIYIYIITVFILYKLIYIYIYIIDSVQLLQFQVQVMKILHVKKLKNFIDSGIILIHGDHLNTRMKKKKKDLKST